MKESKLGRRLLIILLVAVVFAVSFLLATALLGNDEPQSAHDVTGVTSDGQIRSLSDNFGKRGTVLLFFDLETPKAIELLQQVDKLAPKYDVDVMAVACRVESKELKQYPQDHQKILQDLKINPEIIIYDVDDTMAKTYNVSATPITYFIDKNGTVVDGFIASITDDTLKESFAAID